MARSLSFDSIRSLIDINKYLSRGLPYHICNLCGIFWDTRSYGIQETPTNCMILSEIYVIKVYKEIEYIYETRISSQLMYEIYGIKDPTNCY